MTTRALVSRRAGPPGSCAELQDPSPRWARDIRWRSPSEEVPLNSRDCVLDQATARTPAPVLDRDSRHRRGAGLPAGQQKCGFGPMTETGVAGRGALPAPSRSDRCTSHIARRGVTSRRRTSTRPRTETSGTASSRGGRRRQARKTGRVRLARSSGGRQRTPAPVEHAPRGRRSPQSTRLLQARVAAYQKVPTQKSTLFPGRNGIQPHPGVRVSSPKRGVSSFGQ